MLKHEEVVISIALQNAWLSLRNRTFVGVMTSICKMICDYFSVIFQLVYLKLLSPDKHNVYPR
jgi:hypothetical protein